MNKSESITQLATDFINNTNKNIFLTGKAGTGKTTFLKQIYQETYKQTVIAAPTGIAAINAGGSTLHSLFQLPFGSFIPDSSITDLYSERTKFNTPTTLIKELKMNEMRRDILREVELLIIDEVSMLRADLLDAIDVILRHVRRKKDLPFGGIQILFIGDLLQLPPVVQDSEWQILKKYYNSPYFFDAHAIKEAPLVYLELDKIFRQGDPQFIDLLNNLRTNSITTKDTDLLNQFYKPDFKPTATDNYIRLTTHNYQADEFNRAELTKLNSPSIIFEAEVEGQFYENTYPVDYELELKKGAQVMFVKNDVTGAQRYFNGKIGVISSIKEGEIHIEFSDGSKSVSVDRYTWENKKYKLNELTGEIEEEVLGTFKQYPLKLAWAITVHKSQGLTFDKAIIDVGKAFAPGQIYVALSRLTNLSGLVLNTPVNFDSLTVDNQIITFSNSKNPQHELAGILTTASQAYFKEYVLDSFNFENLAYLFKKHMLSYATEKKKAVKTKYDTWGQNLYSDFIKEQEVAALFLHKLERFFAHEPDLNYLIERIKAAIQYFENSLEKLIQRLNEHQAHLASHEKRVKSYSAEITQLETQLSKQLKKMQKSYLMIASLTEEKH